MSDSLWPHGLQHARLSCSSLIPGVCSNSCPLSWWCHLTVSSSAALFSFQFSSVQSLSRVQLFVTPWIIARQASLSITNSRSSFKLMSIESVMPSSHLILCRPLLLLPPIPPSIRVFSNESTLRIIRETQIKVTMRYCHNSTEWLKRKRLTISRVDEEEEHWELMYYWKRNSVVSYKVIIPQDPEKSYVHTKT